MSNVPPSQLRGAVDLSALVRRANAPAPGADGAAPASGATASVETLVFETSDAGFERVIELSSTVPVVVEFVAPGLEPAMPSIVESYRGRLLLAVVDATTSPQLAQAFQVREVPAVAAVIAGRPVNLFLGTPSDAETRQVFDELLRLASENGVTGTISPSGEPDDGEQAEPADEPLPPHHQEAYDAISAGDYATAISEYKQALAKNPRDALAVAGLAQVSLLQRLQGADAGQIRAAAAEKRDDVAAQLAVADLDVSGGHLDDAFDRLLELFPSLDAAGKDAVRTRLLDYFELAGADDPRVLDARRRLASLLY